MFPENSGAPKSSILIGFSIINHPFWGTLIFGNTPIDSLAFEKPFFGVDPSKSRSFSILAFWSSALPRLVARLDPPRLERSETRRKMSHANLDVAVALGFLERSKVIGSVGYNPKIFSIYISRI